MGIELKRKPPIGTLKAKAIVMTSQYGEFTPKFGGYRFGSNFFHGVVPKPDKIVSNLMDGVSISVFGPRRIGKASLLAEARECLQAKGKNVIWVDLNIHDSLTASITEIFNSMQHGKDKGMVHSIREWAQKSEIFTPEVKTIISSIISGTFESTTENFEENYAKALYRETGRQLKAMESESKPIIIFDELTTMLKNAIERAVPGEERQVVAKLNSFLGMLRHWRTEDVGIAMAVSGSVSLNWLGRKYGIRFDSVNDCVPIKVKPMTREYAKELVELCVRSKPPKNWNEELTEELLNLLPEYFPGVVQLAYNEIVSAEEITMETLRGPIMKSINELLWDQYFMQFDSSFNNYGPSERDRAKKLFAAIDSQKGGILEMSKVSDILDESGQEEFEMDAHYLRNCLYADYFIGMELDGISYSSGLIPVWKKMAS